MQLAIRQPQARHISPPQYWQHGAACVDHPATIGAGTKIWHFTHIMSGARIGKDCVISQGCYVAATAVIGDRCRIQNNVSVYDGVVLEDDVFVGPSAVFTNVLYPRAFHNQHDAYAQTLVKRGATIGANATILCGVTIGEYAMIGAGAVITKDVEPYAVMAGPAALLMRKMWEE